MTIIRSQQVASRAYDRVTKVKVGDKSVKEYKSFAMKFPALIHASGLVQATAFAFAKSAGSPQRQLLDDLAVLLDQKTGEELHGAARTYAVERYLRLTEEALIAASWLKRYAEALLVADPVPVP